MIALAATEQPVSQEVSRAWMSIVTGVDDYYAEVYAPTKSLAEQRAQRIAHVPAMVETLSRLERIWHTLSNAPTSTALHMEMGLEIEKARAILRAIEGKK